MNPSSGSRNSTCSKNRNAPFPGRRAQAARLGAVDNMSISQAASASKVSGPRIPGSPQSVRVVAYVDGFNLYFGIRDSGLKRCLWLDLPQLASNLLKPGQALSATKYFTSRVSGPGGKQQRQSLYLDALATIPQSRLKIFYGQYAERPRLCMLCKGTDLVPSEKMTDVNIATEMLVDAFQNRYDVALLISADSDLCPPIDKIRALFPSKRVVVAFPPGRGSSALRKCASAAFVIGRAKLAGSQFPDRINAAGGVVLARPTNWS